MASHLPQGCFAIAEPALPEGALCSGDMAPPRLLFASKSFTDLEKLVAFVQHADKTADTVVFGFEQGMEFTQSGVFSAKANAVL